MKEPCSLKTTRAAKQRQFVVRGKKRSGCRYASIFFCQGTGDRARRTDSSR
ncbi:MAG: hypothetical protein WDO72_10115 [Pseudomonadota bacterium]